MRIDKRANIKEQVEGPIEYKIAMQGWNKEHERSKPTEEGQ